MPKRLNMSEAVALVGGIAEPALVAVDGLPVSGKSTLAERIHDHLGYTAIYLDDFVRPESEWPSRSKPAFPFEYIRYDEFLAAVMTLAQTGACRYHPFDWSTLAVSPSLREVKLDLPVLVEGVSALNPELCDFYGLRLFVESDPATTLEAAFARGVGAWGREWRELFLPSAQLYMQTQPEKRADFVVLGRGMI
jgi:uridine kinase